MSQNTLLRHKYLRKLAAVSNFSLGLN